MFSATQLKVKGKRAKRRVKKKNSTTASDSSLANNSISTTNNVSSSSQSSASAGAAPTPAATPAPVESTPTPPATPAPVESTPTAAPVAPVESTPTAAPAAPVESTPTAAPVESTPPPAPVESTSSAASASEKKDSPASTEVSKEVNKKIEETPPPPPPPPKPKPKPKPKPEKKYDPRRPEWLQIKGKRIYGPYVPVIKPRNPDDGVEIRSIQEKPSHINKYIKDDCEILKLSSTPFSVLLENDMNNRDIKIHRLEECVPSGVGVQYPNVIFKSTSKLFYPLQDENVRSTFINTYEKDQMMYKFRRQTIRKKLNDSVFYFIYNMENYFCFLYDAVPYLHSFLELRKQQPRIKLLMQYSDVENKTFKSYVMPILELLGITQKDIVMLSSETKYRRIYISSSYTHDEGYHDEPRAEIFKLYKKISDAAYEKLKNNLPVLPKKIFVSEHKNMTDKFAKMAEPKPYIRKFTNETDFIEYTNQKKCKEIFVEDTTFSLLEKIIMFSKADVVIGQMGETVANALFSPSTTRFISIVTPTYLIRFPRFRYCYKNTDIKYFTKTEQVETSKFKTYMKVQKKTDVYGIIATVTEVVNEQTSKIEYIDENGTKQEETIENDKSIK